MTVSGVVLDDPLLDGQVLRLLGSVPYGGADVGEVLTAARAVHGVDLDSWYRTWTGLGERVLALADSAAAAGRAETARLAFWRASSYLRTAGLMVMAPGDDRYPQSVRRQREAFARGAALMGHPPQPVRIPYEGTTLPGYFFPVDDDPRPRATVLTFGGYDSTAEECYFFNAAAALSRGYHVLVFEGPGQGSALVDQHLTMRPDWDAVVTPVLDHLLARPDVDPTRVALVGLSLGAHLAPRAAAREHRLAACVADCGTYDMHADFLARLPEQVRSGFEAGDPDVVAGVGQMLDHLAGQPTAGWALRRGMLVHGVSTVLDYVRLTAQYTLAGYAPDIRCPTWVCNAEDDPIGVSAPRLVEALTCDKRFITFTRAEGAGDHCEAGARTLFHARMFDWLDRLLRPRD